MCSDRDLADRERLLDRAYTAERDKLALALELARDHDDNHVGNIRWCSSAACRTVAAWLRL
jgi:hypothetical protein